MNIRLLILFILLGSGSSILAEEPLKIKFRSRALLDATVSGYGKDKTQGYYKLEDFRVGFKVNYLQYEIKADIGLGGGKTKIKDLQMNYHFKNSILSVGNGYEPFSMDMLISTVDLRFHQSATSVLAFADSRKLGVTYHFHNRHWYAATGVYTNNDINEIGNEQKNSFVSTSRIVWRNHNEEKLFHIGGAFSIRSAEINNEEETTGNISAAGITSMFPEPLLNADITNMGSEIKGLVECLYTSPRFMLQGEYFLNRINRTENSKAYHPHGGYIQAGYLLIGRNFIYDDVYAVPSRPETSRAIELTLRFNYTNMNDRHAGIMGGEEKDLSLGINYYQNNHIGFKINGSYVWSDRNCNSFYTKNLFLIQGRVQYVF